MTMLALVLAAGMIPEWVMNFEIDDEAGKPVLQKAVSSAATPEETVEPDGVRRFVWPSVVDGAGARRQVRVELTVRDVPGGCETEGLLANRGEGLRVLAFEGPFYGPVPAVTGRDALHVPFEHGARMRVFPAVGQRPPADKPNGLRTWQYGGDETWRYGSTFDLSEDKGMMRYPSIRCTMSYFFTWDGAKGHYFASYDPAAGSKDFGFTYDAKAACGKMSMRHNLFVRPGETVAIPRTVGHAFAGSWHAVAREYRAWHDTVWPIPPREPFLLDFPGWLMVICKQQNGSIMWPYTEFDQLADLMDRYSLDHVLFFGWHRGGHDHLYPDYDPDPDMGGERALRDGLKLLKDRGKHAVLYFNGQLMEKDWSSFWTNHAESCSVVRRDGSFSQERWLKFRGDPEHVFNKACLSTSAWRERQLRLVTAAKDYGASGVLIDQLALRYPEPCFSPNHPHPVGQHVFCADRVSFFELLKRRLGPDFGFFSEGHNDTLFHTVTGCHGNYKGIVDNLLPGAYVPVRNRWNPDDLADWDLPKSLYIPDDDRARRCNRTTDEFSEMAYYTFPGTLFMDRNWDCSLLMPTEINSALITGHPIDFEIRYIPDRAYAQHGQLPSLDAYEGMVMKHDPVRMRAVPVEKRFDALKAAMDFRRANRDVLLRGTFRDTDGFAIDAHPSLLAKGWLSEDGRTFGVLVYNRDHAAHPCALTVPNGAFAEASAPGCGAVNPKEDIPAESVRLYRYDLKGELPVDGGYRP